LLEHGGNLAQAATKFGIPLENWLDLSTGINPVGYPVPAIPAQIWQRLPMDDDGLLDAARNYYSCQHIMATAGSQAALQVLPTLRKPCVVAVLDPMYKEHAHAWRSHGHEVRTFTGLQDEAALNSADVVLLCNPNNPSAAKFDPTDLLDLHTTLQKRGGWLIVDEAFIDCTPQQSIGQFTHLDGLFVLRSLGKFFGLAGLRVGFLLAQQAQLNRVQQVIGPWSISGASRYVTKLALADLAWQQTTRARLKTDSQRLATLLQTYGLNPDNGTMLFQLVHTPHFEKLHQHFAEQGIWVRLFKELGALRFGLPPDYGWQKLEDALKKLPF
jgi:cobalamin biosynthetic protein CobC